MSNLLLLSRSPVICRYLSVVPRYMAPIKDLSSSFPDKWDPHQVESGWYDWWKDQGYFKPQSSSLDRDRFSVVLPPPNVTGVLHLGHALTTTIQDSLVRWNRMKGCDTVWIPGTDHAGIATQVVVEKGLMATKGVTRHQLGREMFLKEVERWQEEKGENILRQLEHLGASLDWSRTEFTLSPKFRTAVNTAFIKLFEKGLIYRKEGLVNWCPELQSTISDIEVDHVKVEGRTEFELPGYSQPVQFGVMTNLAYKVVEEGEEEIVVSTTRPETMLADTAVAVHPDDGRYSHLHGKKVRHPFRKEDIPIITDTGVDMEIGTGAVKITPGHDFNDWSMGERHNLSVINMFDSTGHLTPNCGQFTGQSRWESRVSVVDALDHMGLLRGEADHDMMVPVCSRTGDVVEPLVRSQWFVNTTHLAEKADSVVRSGDLKFDPPHYSGYWQKFMGEGNSRDWCISRQIWWGHQIPAYSCSVSGGNQETVWVAAQSEQEARERAAVRFGCADGDVIVIQDTDVLDTWFSSGLYPFAALGWPDISNQDLAKYYPLDLMETGHDILFFWVGRMVMLGLALTDKLPFHHVLLHGVVCDPQGRKMSKSLGNVVDPLHLIHGASLDQLHDGLNQSVDDGHLSIEEKTIAENDISNQFPQGIPASGVDALRWGLATFDLKSQSIALDPQVFQTSGAWCNKVWQLARFLQMAHTRSASSVTPSSSPGYQPGLMDMWILSQLSETVSIVNQHLETRDLHLVTKILRNFIYTDLCDIYIEVIKPILSDPNNPQFQSSLLILHSCVLSSLRLLHPIMPFITEELYQRLPKLPKERRQESIMIDSFPQPKEWKGFHNPDLTQTVEEVLLLVKGVRAMKQTYDLGHSVNPLVLICGGYEEVSQFGEVIQTLAKCGQVNFTEEKIDPDSLPHGFISYTVNYTHIYMDVGDLIDYDKEMKKIEAKYKKVEKERSKLAKSQKGKFQYRMDSQIAAEKNMQLDEVVTKLNEQVDILIRLKTKQS